MASAASRHMSSRNRRPVISTPIGNPVPSSHPAGTHAEGAQVNWLVPLCAISTLQTIEEFDQEIVDHRRTLTLDPVPGTVEDVAAAQPG
jgi:hypothetical protein